MSEGPPPLSTHHLVRVRAALAPLLRDCVVSSSPSPIPLCPIQLGPRSSEQQPKHPTPRRRKEGRKGGASGGKRKRAADAPFELIHPRRPWPWGTGRAPPPPPRSPRPPAPGNGIDLAPRWKKNPGLSPPARVILLPRFCVGLCHLRRGGLFEFARSNVSVETAGRWNLASSDVWIWSIWSEEREIFGFLGASCE